ncbi:MAG: hypothetical protein SFV15_09570, partial [Polyangiaceae bacterium]|nr:hypothetical protein [Polyangiaceae bacterium]
MRTPGPFYQICVDCGQRSGKAVQDGANGVPFLGVDVIDSTRDKSQLLVYFFSHRSAVSFERSWRNPEKTRTPMLLFPSLTIKNSFIFELLPFLDEN